MWWTIYVMFEPMHWLMLFAIRFPPILPPVKYARFNRSHFANDFIIIVVGHKLVFHFHLRFVPLVPLIQWSASFSRDTQRNHTVRLQLLPGISNIALFNQTAIKSA